MPEVAKVATPVSAEDFTRAVARVFSSVQGTAATVKQLGMLFGQWSLETATGKSMFNNAVGNIKATDLQNQAYFSQDTGAPGVVRADGVIGEGINHFRAFSSLEDGIRAWMSLLKVPRYKAGWQGLLSDDPQAFAAGITDGGYVSPASADSYIAGIMSRYNQFMSTLAPKIKDILGSASLGIPVAMSGAVATILTAIAALGGTFLITRWLTPKRLPRS